jgi:hypothetical protein
LQLFFWFIPFSMVRFAALPGVSVLVPFDA